METRKAVKKIRFISAVVVMLIAFAAAMPASAQRQLYTDRDVFGLKGRVKRVTTWVYRAMLDYNKLVCNTALKPIKTESVLFNSNGMLITGKLPYPLPEKFNNPVYDESGMLLEVNDPTPGEYFGSDIPYPIQLIWEDGRIVEVRNDNPLADGEYDYKIMYGELGPEIMTEEAMKVSKVMYVYPWDETNVMDEQDNWLKRYRITDIGGNCEITFEKRTIDYF